MKINDIKNSILESFSVFSFEYKGKIGGIDPISYSKFIMWYGEDNDTIAKNIDEAVTIPFFDGKSLTDLVNQKIISKKDLIEYNF